MCKSFLITIFVLFIYQINIAQSPALVEDYIVGEEGSIEGRVFQFQNTLTYLGFSEDGTPAILQYDKNPDQVSVLATSEDFDGEISSLTSNTLEMIVFTREGPDGSPNKNIYRAFENDFSDIIKLYNSGDADLLTFRFHQDHYMIVEQYIVDGEDKINFKIVTKNGDVDDFLIGLDGSASDFRFTSFDGNFIVVPKLDYLDGKSIIAYNIDTKQEVPFTDIVPGFEDCGLISRIGGLNDNIIYYDCEGTYIFDTGLEQFLNTEDISYFILYDKPEFLYVIFDGGIYKFFKNTGQLELVIDEYNAFRPYFSTIVLTKPGLNSTDISLLNFETDELSTYSTDFPTNISLRFTGFGIVPKGVHLVIYESLSDNGVIANINEESFTVIDSVYNVNFNNRPVAYDEDIYFTHQDPEVGQELFIIDYDVSSLNEIANEEIVSVSPNPVTEYLQINHKSDSKLNSIQIIDQNGRIVKTVSDQSLINVSELNPGLYFLKAIYEGGKNGVTRFVKN